MANFKEWLILEEWQFFANFDPAAIDIVPWTNTVHKHLEHIASMEMDDPLTRIMLSRHVAKIEKQLKELAKRPDLIDKDKNALSSVWSELPDTSRHIWKGFNRGG